MQSKESLFKKLSLEADSVLSRAELKQITGGENCGMIGEVCMANIQDCCEGLLCENGICVTGSVIIGRCFGTAGEWIYPTPVYIWVCEADINTYCSTKLGNCITLMNG